MTYTESYSLLKNLFNQEKDIIEIPGSSVRIVNHSFTSAGRNVLPGAENYFCSAHGIHFREERREQLKASLFTHTEVLSIGDASFGGNSEFRYSVFVPDLHAKAENVIVLLHGLNERSWDKYLPWALRLVERTGSAVVLFPIAFHMNRSPVEWRDSKQMRIVAEGRQEQFPTITASSFANAAISSRLHSIPQRFFWTGLQTYNDVLQLVRQIRAGKLRCVQSSARINLFAYSVGSFLSQILMMTDEDGTFSDSKLFIFCGGPTFDRMYPVSKYIMDSEALISLYAFYVEHLENEFKRDPRIAHYFQEHTSGQYFRAMLSNRKLKDVRERRLREIASCVTVVVLRKDEVVQPSEVLNTLNGDFRDIPITVHVLDFAFNYSHVNPFPLMREKTGEVDKAFDDVFERAVSFLS